MIVVLGQVITKGAGIPNHFIWGAGVAGAIMCELLAEFAVKSWAFFATTNWPLWSSKMGGMAIAWPSNDGGLSSTAIDIWAASVIQN
jgi:hypothetical protein